MAQWTIQTGDQAKKKEVADRERLGDEDYEDRVNVAKQKAARLHWKEEMFYASQFESMALAMNKQNWPKLREKNGEFWKKLFAKLAS